eukprot:TRINITY_DN5809_c0_g1_i2.p1 TRINITY_DN5809_c0_g1~~TRINITY_DN5809_c0_g1_i2.p1  ORF type:complete len:608 (-),score=66.25 TRINITY_DN5809_c0_g1_i2:33-1856(-)
MINGEESASLIHKESTPQKKLSLVTKIVFGLPAFAYAINFGLYGIYLLVYFNNTLGVSIDGLNETISIGMMFIVLSFPIFGWLLDNSATRWGRRKPWLVICAPIYYISNLTIWFPPNESLTLVWLGVWNVIALSSSYLVLTPYSSLGVEISPDFEERSSLFSYFQGFFMMGYLLGVVLPSLLESWLGDSMEDVQRIFFGLTVANLVVGLISTTVMLMVVEEPKEDLKTEKEPNIPLLAGIRFAVFYNKAFQILLTCITFQNIMPYTLQFLPYWIESSIELSLTWETILLVAVVVSGFTFIPVWNFISNYKNKLYAYRLTLFLGFVAYCLMIIPLIPSELLATKLVALLVASFYGCTGVSMTYTNFLYLSLQGDVLDYDELLTGYRRESQYVNFVQYLNWLCSFTGTVLPLAVIDYLGYNNSDPFNQTEEVRYGISIIVGPVAGLCCLLSLVAFLFYPIDQNVYLLIQQGVKNHKQGIEAKDPITQKIIHPPYFQAVNLTHDENRRFNEFEIKWKLFHFSLYELSLTQKYGMSVLVWINGVLFVLWSSGFIGTIVWWGFWPSGSEYLSYLLLVMFSYTGYFFKVLLVAWELRSAKIDQNIRYHINFYR